MEVDRLIGQHPSWLAALDAARALAPTGLPVVIAGETGTGKEQVARLVHATSRRPGPFVPVDCGSLTPGIVEAELFGHVRGAFTDARADRQGLVTSADTGTLFLDEIAELPLELQTRLLRLAQEGTIRPVGGDAERRVDVLHST
jgi:transcriptional regulator with AAA-type ATPase domain